MEFIKTEKGWLNLETEQLTLFGDLAIALYNEIEKSWKKIDSAISIYYSLSNSSFPDIIGRDDDLDDRQNDIFMTDEYIAAIMLFPLKNAPIGSIPYSDQTAYFPIYFSDLEKIFENAPELSKDLLIYQIQIKMGFLLLVLTTRQDHLNDEQTRQLYTDALDSWLPFFNKLPIPTITKRYDNQYKTVYVVENIGFLYYRDILELINYEYSLESCPICQKVFVKRDGRTNFCPKCSADKKAQKKYNDQKRKRNTIQIEHKAIVDMLRNRGEDYNDFVTESYYYRDLIEGKKVSPCPVGYDSSIQTKEQYEEWLKQKHQELTKRPKKRPTH